MTIPHLIEIDKLVLIGVDHHRPDQLRAVTEAAVRRALSEAMLPRAWRVNGAEPSVAREVAASVASAVEPGQTKRMADSD